MQEVILALLLATGQANPVSGLYNESSKEFLGQFGFPTYIAVGLFALFGVLMLVMTMRFNKNMESANTERKAITTQFTGVLENALQNNTEQLTLVNETLRNSCAAISTMDSNQTAQHGEILSKINACDVRLSSVEGKLKKVTV